MALIIANRQSLFWVLGEMINDKLTSFWDSKYHGKIENRKVKNKTKNESQFFLGKNYLCTIVISE